MEKFIFLLIIIWLITVYVLLNNKLRKSRKKLNQEQIKSLKKLLKNIELNIDSTQHQILEIDKLYHKVLREAWYNWTFWEILKLNPKEITDINLIWELHKIRNKIAHDFDIMDQKTLLVKAKTYKKEVEKLIITLT